MAGTCSAAKGSGGGDALDCAALEAGEGNGGGDAFAAGEVLSLSGVTGA